MRADIENIWVAINNNALPDNASILFGPAWSQEEGRFFAQETYILDFKDKIPSKFSEGFGAGIVRLALAMYNSYGGLIVFGVEDGEKRVVGIGGLFPIEAFNRVLSDLTGVSIECLTRDYSLEGMDQGVRVAAVLIPRRGTQRPATLKADFASYKKGTLWTRDRHEVRVADSRAFPILYSDRANLPSESGEQASKSIHRALPPDPATINHFVGREQLLASLWEWFVHSSQPRFYLHGPGGSGKSTLAYHFSQTLADAGIDVALPGGDSLDYVLFISGKETELDTIAAKEQRFVLRQFTSANEQYQQILIESGVRRGEKLPDNEEDLLDALGELFDSYNGLVVIDDIDALSRQNSDTGEESLFAKALLGKKRTRILYTLRYPAAHARKHSLLVPGLDDDEFYKFLEVCCEKFDVKPPTPEQMVQIAEQTANLPLLIENVVGLRKYSTSFRDALDQFQEKGGDEARRYLYQREYDQLSKRGKSREILAALAYIGTPVPFRTLTHLFSYSGEQVRDALSECSGIFLATQTDDAGNTLFTVAPSSRLFLVSISNKLSKAELLQRRVELLGRATAQYTAAEATIIVELEELINASEFNRALVRVDAIPTSDPVLANPRVLHLIGQICCEHGGGHKDRARQCFRSAAALQYGDVRMMRDWFYLERNSGYGLGEAKRIAHDVVTAKHATPRTRSEFLSKLGECLATEARGHQNVSSEKCNLAYRASIGAYSRAVRVGRGDRGFDMSKTLNWLDAVIGSYARALVDDIDGYLQVIDTLLEDKGDIDPNVADSIARGLLRIQIRVTDQTRPRVVGVINRAIGRLTKGIKNENTQPGLSGLRDTLSNMRDRLSSGGARST